MKESKNKPLRRNEISLYLTPRYILGLILILASFTSAYLISQASDKTFLVWAATVDLAPGEALTDSDLTTVRVRLIDNAEQYLSASKSIVGAAVLRPIGAAELIPSFSLASDIDPSLQIVPISIAREWAPIDLVSGSMVDVYGIPNRNAELLDGSKARSSLILSAVAIDSIDSSARDLGGRIGVSLLVPELDVAKIIAAINKSEFLLVRRSLMGI